MKVSNVDEMRAMDRYAVEQLGIPEAILMENAGQAAASVRQGRSASATGRS
jgi:NAD(P)H-hydrate epimerase